MLEVLGNIYGLLSKPEQADSLLEKSLKLKKQIHTPADPELASIYYSLAAQKHNLGYYKLCFALIDTAILYQTKIYGVQSREVGKSLTLLAESFRKAGHIDSAYTIINKSEMIFSALGDTTSEEYLRVLMELGAINVANGEIYDAEKIWRQTLGLSKKLFESPHPVIISNINGLSNVLKETEEFAEAEILYTKSLEMTNKVYGHMHLNTAAVLNNLASLYYYTENYSKADALYADSYEILKTILGEKHPSTVSILYNIANLTSDLGDFNSAIKNYKKVLELDIAVFGEIHPNVASDYSGLATLYKRQEKYQQAINNYYKSLNIRRSVYDNPYHPYIGFNLISLAEIFVELGNFEEADNFYEEGLACFVKTYGRNHEKVKTTAQNYARVLQLQNSQHISPDDLISKTLQNVSKE